MYVNIVKVIIIDYQKNNIIVNYKNIKYFIALAFPKP